MAVPFGFPVRPGLRWKPGTRRSEIPFAGVAVSISVEGSGASHCRGDGVPDRVSVRPLPTFEPRPSGTRIPFRKGSGRFSGLPFPATWAQGEALACPWGNGWWACGWCPRSWGWWPPPWSSASPGKSFPKSCRCSGEDPSRFSAVPGKGPEPLSWISPCRLSRS